MEVKDDTEHCDFVQKLIDAVRERRCLYDKKHIAYFNRREREKAWREIGQQLGRSDVDCHKRWKLLREKLAKELKKRDKALENGETFLSDWACFDSIMFVEDHISPRKKIDRQPLMLVKDLSKKRHMEDNDTKNSYAPAEKRVYNTNDFNFFMQLSKTAATAATANQSNGENPSLSCSLVKTEPIDKQSDELNSISANDNPFSTASTASSSSSSLSATAFNIDREIPGSLDLTKAVDNLLKDLREKKESSFDFMKNLTNALKIKDLDIFKYDGPPHSLIGEAREVQQRELLKINLNDHSNESSKFVESDYDDDCDESAEYLKNMQNTEDSIEVKNSTKLYNLNHLGTDFAKKFKCNDLAKTEQTTKTEINLPLEATSRAAEKDQLFGKLVTSMLADITDEEYKDDAKFSIMQLLVNAKRASKAKKLV